MKILWFCTDPVVYDKSSRSYRIGGGWVTTLLSALKSRRPDWIFGICCEGKGHWGEETAQYYRYPVSQNQSFLMKAIKRFDPRIEDKVLIPFALKAIQDFKPDVIQIFGTETTWGLIVKYTSIPVIIHFQGALTPIYNANYPPGISRGSYIFSNPFDFSAILKKIYFAKVFRARAERETEILSNCKNYFGRTAWDKAVISCGNPQAAYFTCWEMLRPAFSIEQTGWHPHKREKKRIVSVISTPIYKGQDLILKTAALLKRRQVDFVWEVWGISEMSFFEKRLRLQTATLNVNLRGVEKSPEKLRDILLDADCYVHPSYIENSPNSLCEAQILGVPSIATNVGGVSSVIEHMKTGILVPANDPWMLADRIMQLNNTPVLAAELGAAGRSAALQRHNPDIIVEKVAEAYQNLAGQT